MKSVIGLSSLLDLTAVLVGAATAFQPGVNATFGRFAGAPIHGTLINFAGGLVATLAIIVAMHATPPESAALAQGPWWMWTSGLLGVFFVTGSLLISPRMGQASFLVAMIAGQLIGGAVIDHFGLMGYQQVSLTIYKLFGFALILVAALDRQRRGDQRTHAFTILAVFVGAATSFQPGVNAAFGKFSGAPIHGTFVNFATGLVATIAIAFSMRVKPPQPSGLRAGPWWMWTGGLFGVFFVTASLLLSPRMGQANFLGAMIAGQLIGGAIIDHFGLMGYPKSRFSIAKLFAFALTVAGALIVKLK